MRNPFKNKALKKAKEAWLEAEELYEKAKIETAESSEQYKEWLDNINPSYGSMPEILNQKLVFYMKKRAIEEDFTMLGLLLDKRESAYVNLKREIRTKKFIGITTVIMIIIGITQVAANYQNLIDFYHIFF